MAKKTNKTSHVMDLLTNGASQETNATANGFMASDPSGQEKKGDVQSHTVTPTKVTVVDEGSRNDRIAQDILNKLSEELEGEMRQEMASQPKPAPQNQAAAQPAPSQPVSDAAYQKSSIKSIQKVIPESQIDVGLKSSEFRFINVMEELLLDEDVGSFLDQYDMCKCQQCIADVCALTLTRLPSKYVVASKGSLSPILSYYKNRYKILMLTEFMKACEKVSQHPHHGRIDLK